jgi:UDP-N-acetylglucosamine:LPS N-acetylglucosamine transferase
VKPLVVSVDMGYGHMRPAHAVADPLGVPVLHADRAPLADAAERRRWLGARKFHEIVSKASQLPIVGGAFGWAMDTVTHIAPFVPDADQSRANLAVRWLERQARLGVGRGLVERLRDSGAPLFTTFYSTAVVADRAGCEGVHCLVTDADLHRVWVQADPKRSRATYFAPSERAGKRLALYGVEPDHIHFTGYPLPTRLLGGEDLAVARENLEARLARLSGADGKAPLVTFAVGGAGAQTGIPKRFLPRLRAAIESERVRVALVAGIREDTRDKLEAVVQGAGLSERVPVVYEREFADYLARFDALLAETDVLWTKPSEVSFFAALGLPLLLAPTVGAQEIANREWATEHGAAKDSPDPARADEWLLPWASDGTFAAMARAGFERLPKQGTYRILEALAG